MIDNYSYKHRPVLVNEVLEYLNPQPGKRYLDVTFGAGGHTQAILDKEPDCSVIALDWDTVALETYGAPLQDQYGQRLLLIWGSFSHIYKLLKKEGIEKVDGILADFGTSQMHIFNRPGFSFARQSPLDMRMSPAYQKVTAADIVNTASQEELSTIFFTYGEERHSRAIARMIVQERGTKPLQTTTDLIHIIQKVVGTRFAGEIHPATRVFQALRIVVNHELDNIQALLSVCQKILNPGGRMVCISFHSLEDRMVKNFFRQKEQENQFRALTSKVVTASKQEVDSNASARSARLRAAEYIGV